MDFKDEIRQFAKRVDRLLPQIKTEEATKTSLIMPFLICRLYFTPNRLRIGLLDKDKKETKHDLGQLDDIYNHSEQILETGAWY